MGLVKKLVGVFRHFMPADSCFKYPYEKQKKYIDSIPEPRDNFERGFFQFKCQMFLVGWTHWLLNVASLPLYVYKKLTIKHLCPEKTESRNAVFCTPNLHRNILPESLFSEFGEIEIFDHSVYSSLNDDDRRFLKELARRYPFNWHFRLKCMLKIAMTRYVLDKFSPKALIASTEYSFTSSVLTEYLRRNGVEHINIMHGEKLFFIRDSFFVFDRFYVWEENYKPLFKKLRADVSCIRVELPPVLNLPTSEETPIYDFTFYLQNETPSQVETIVSYCETLINAGYKVSVRPHPRYTKISEEQLHGLDVNIEINKELPIEKSLKQTKCAVSLYSTVLLQAYANGIAFAIDDITRPEMFERMKTLSYIGFSLEHRLLSDILNEASKKTI